MKPFAWNEVASKPIIDRRNELINAAACSEFYPNGKRNLINDIPMANIVYSHQRTAVAQIANAAKSALTARSPAGQTSQLTRRYDGQTAQQ